MLTSKEHQLRGNMMRTLAIQWLREKRPDVMTAIKNEVDKKYPTAKRGPKAAELPAELDAISE